jgi:molecular chaperone DnaK (HSP70)
LAERKARGEERVLGKAIGLDFGTTNSALAIAKPDGTVQLAQFKGEATFRSVLYFDESDNAGGGRLRVVAGPDAIENYLNAKTTGRLIQSMKSHLASRLFNQTQIMGETYSLEELIGILLRYLRQSAESEFGDLGSTLVVGRPVHFAARKLKPTTNLHWTDSAPPSAMPVSNACTFCRSRWQPLTNTSASSITMRSCSLPISVAEQATFH